MAIPVIKLLKKKSYLAMIHNAAHGENHMFRNLYATVDGIEQDIVDNGQLSCAFFVSAVLYVNKFIRDMHANMTGLEKDLVGSGWLQIDEPREGAILVWKAEVPTKKRTYQPTGVHGGFFVGNGRAISNASENGGVPVEHDWTYNGTRKVERIYWHPMLEA